MSGFLWRIALATAKHLLSIGDPLGYRLFFCIQGGV
jgi:hypothetical protein